LSQAGGIGVICDRLLYRNQLCEYALFVVIWISVGETTLMLLTKLLGNPVKAPQSDAPTALSMLIQNITSAVVTGVPSDHV